MLKVIGMDKVTLCALFDCLATRGMGAYGLSDVNQLEHALQSAALAANHNLGADMVIAALFHDIGHLFNITTDIDLASQGIDDKHEESGANLLKSLFGPTVSEAVRGHVAAKRYLCAVDPDYYDQLSDDSKTSMKVQGGIMSQTDIALFEQQPYFKEAVALRRIDDWAKVADLDVPTLMTYQPIATELHQSFVNQQNQI